MAINPWHLWSFSLGARRVLLSLVARNWARSRREFADWPAAVRVCGVCVCAPCVCLRRAAVKCASR